MGSSELNDVVRGDDNLLGNFIKLFFFRRQREIVSRSFKEIEKKITMYIMSLRNG